MDEMRVSLGVPADWELERSPDARWGARYKCARYK